MNSPERVERERRYGKQDIEDSSDVKSDCTRDDEEWEGDDKRKHKSSKLRRPKNGDDVEGSDSSARKRSTGDKVDGRKRSGHPSRVASDGDDYEVSEKPRSKQMKKKQEEDTLGELSSWYNDGELENKQEGGNMFGNGGDGGADGSERRKVSSNFLDHENLQSRTSGKQDRSPDRESEKKEDRDSRYSERRGISREKDHEYSDQGRNPRRRWDESEANWKPEDGNYLEKFGARSRKPSDVMHEGTRDRSVLDSKVNKSTRSHDRDDKGADGERSKSRGRSEALEEDSDRRHHHELQKSEVEYERGISFKQGELERDIGIDDRSRGRVDNWGDRDRDREGSKDSWNRRQSSSHDRETKDGDIAYDHGREWELHKRSRDRIENERPHSRSSGRKDGNRNEAVKTSSKYGISNENYDVIEIQTKPFSYGREESGSTFPRRKEVGHQSELVLGPNNDLVYPQEDGVGKLDVGSAPSGDDSGMDIQAGKARGQQDVFNRSTGGQNSGSGNQESSPFNRARPQGVKGGRAGRGWGRPPGRDSQPIGVPIPMMGPPFGALGMPPPGPMQQLNPLMSPAAVPPITPGVFIPPFAPPVAWPGGRGVEMSMLGVPPVMPPLSSGPSGPGFSPNVGTPPGPGLYINQTGPGRGVPPNSSGPGFNVVIPAGRGQPQDKVPGSGSWVSPRTNTPAGKAPSRGEQNDYSQNFVDTGLHPQNFIRELELTSVVEDYPKLRELIQKKDEIVANSASAPMYFKCDLHEFELSSEFFGTKFDVILVDPPWEEYVHRAPGVTDHLEYWTFEEIMNLKIEAIADTPSFIFLWVGDGVGLEQGRQCLKKWGFRRCEDICWVKTNKTNAIPGLRHDFHTLFQRSKEHCLMGIKGTVRRSTDGHIIHANIDTDVIIAEEPPYGSTAKPEDMYRIIEHFALGRRRLELFGEEHNIRSGWLTVGKGLSSSNFDAKAYIKNFADKEGKAWHGGGGRNPPPEAPHLVLTTPEIESLRPKSPMKNQQQQQQQQQSASISINTGSSANKRPAGNSPQSFYGGNLNPDASTSNLLAPAPWASGMENFKGREAGNTASDGRVPDMYGYGGPYGQGNADYLEYEAHRAMNFL